MSLATGTPTRSGATIRRLIAAPLGYGVAMNDVSDATPDEIPGSAPPPESPDPFHPPTSEPDVEPLETEETEAAVDAGGVRTNTPPDEPGVEGPNSR